MNVLPVVIEHVRDEAALQKYFDDLDRWGFDIACAEFCAQNFEDLIGSLKEPFAGFAVRAKRRGVPACVKVQSSVCPGDRVGIEEAQYDVRDNPQMWGEKGFFGSFASEAFLRYLQEITEIFVREYRYDFVIFEEPIFRVDIPGRKDRFYERFVKLHPGLRYPESCRETTEYLTVQKAKADVLVDFLTGLVTHAKEQGAVRVGVVPRPFVPTAENTPPETRNPACEIGRIARIPGVDTLLSAMRPGSVYAETMRPGEDLKKSPSVFHVEILAHAQTGDVATLGDPGDEDSCGQPSTLLPYEFYRDCVLASAAASPGGFSRHWPGHDHGADERHTEVLTQAAQFAGRLGTPVSPVAFVFSYSGTRHAEPWTCESVLPHYLALAHHMAFTAGKPMLTFFSDTLQQNLAEHPEVQVLVFDEHFPLSPDEMRVISRWWQGEGKRAVVAFGSGVGFAADPELTGAQPCCRSFPGVCELIGLRQEDDPQLIFDNPVGLREVSRVKRSAFLGSEPDLTLTHVANVRRIFGTRASVLYEADLEDLKVPVVAEWRDRSTLALFCGFGLSRETVSAAEKAIGYALREVDAPAFVVDSCDEGLVWSLNHNGYIVVSNLSDTERTALARPGRANIWDCRARRMLPEGDARLAVAPKSFGVFRLVGRRSKLLDVEGVCRLRSVTDGAGRADIAAWAGRTTTFILKASPKSISVDGRPCTVRQKFAGGVYYVTLQQCPPGERVITLKW